MKKAVRKIIDFLSWFSVSITIITLVLTVITTYHVKNVNYFSGYYFLQTAMIFTMTIWGFKILEYSNGKKKGFYSILFFAMALCAIFFRLKKVY